MLNQSEAPTKIKKIIFGPKSKATLLGLFIGANILIFGGMYLVKNPSIKNNFLPNIAGEIEKEDVSAKPAETDENLPAEPIESFSELDGLFQSLNEEIDAQITNMILSRRNYLLGKAMNKIASEGKTLKYWLLQDFNNIVSKMKQELLDRSKNSTSGFGGEYSGKPTDVDNARTILIDFKAVVLALEMVEKENLTYVSPEVLTSRTYVGGLINKSAPISVAIHAKAEEQMWEIVEKNKMSLEAKEQAKQQTKQAIEEMKNGGNTDTKTAK